MSVYRVSVPVEFIVEINDDNVQADARPKLQGDLPIVAVRRALMSLFDPDREKRRGWGVRRIVIRKAEGDIDVIAVDPDILNKSLAEVVRSQGRRLDTNTEPA